MQRTIKFRAWNKIQKRFIYTGPIWQSDFWNAIEADPDIHEIQQFTGLYDVNGKEIYEGDVIKHRYFSMKGVAEVRWSDEEACFLAIEPNGERVILRPNSEIIGNVWEHAQLLDERGERTNIE